MRHTQQSSLACPERPTERPAPSKDFGMKKRSNMPLLSRTLLAAALVAPLVSAPAAPVRSQEPPQVSLGATVNARSASPSPRAASADALRWADAQLKRMSLEEKIGQLISVGINARFFNRESDEFKELS